MRRLLATATEDSSGTVPLDVIEQRDQTLRRRRIGSVVVACALVLGPSAALAADHFADGGSTDRSDAGADNAASSPVRIVTPGERVDVVRGVRLWLTDKGKHWSTPLRSHQFLGLGEDSAGDKAGRAAVSAQTEPLGGSFFLSGMYHGLSTAPGRVEASFGDTKVTGTVLTLVGSPGWGVWYARAPLSTASLQASYDKGGLTVTVYDAAGKAVARSDTDGR